MRSVSLLHMREFSFGVTRARLASGISGMVRLRRAGAFVVKGDSEPSPPGGDGRR
jgi:hypothetical protein